MKTASDILIEAFRNNGIPKPTYGLAAITLKAVTEAINAAREDAIRECAERVETKDERDYNNSIGEHYKTVVDKESILSLIEELK